MKAKDFYELKPKEIIMDLTGYLIGGYFNHLAKSLEHVDEYNIDFSKNTRIKVKILAQKWHDERRFWRVATVWFDDFPFMIIKNAGREGDDHSGRVITNEEVYQEAIQYIRSKLWRPHVVGDTINLEFELPEFVEFYGMDLSEDLK